MKRIAHTLVGMAIAGVILAPATWAVDGTSGTTGPAYLDAETNQLFDSQDPPHYLVYGAQTVTLTGHGTVTLTGGGTGTETNTYVLVLPKATVTLAGTSTLTQTHFCTTSAESGGIPCAGTGSKIDIGWLPTGTATDSVVTGADPRLTDARASTNTLYGDGVAFRTGTGTASGTVTSAAVATNPTVVNTSTAVATQTLSAPGGTKTWSTTLTITQTDLATTATGAGIIPMTRTNSKVSSGVIPWGEATDILPNGDATYDLGSSGASKRWRHGYFSGNVYSANNNFFTSYTNSASSDLSVSTAGACQVVAKVDVSVTATAALALVFGAISFGTTDPSMGCAMLISDDTAATVMDWSRTMGIAYGLVSGGSMATSGNWSFTGTGTHTVTLQICNHQAVSHNCTVNASSNDWHNATLTVQMYGH